jgi:hypothetical protein
MVRLRLSVDAKCPRHPNRRHEAQRRGRSICLALFRAAESARAAKRYLRFAGKLGAEVRRKDRRRRSPPRAPGRPQDERRI